MEHINDPNHVPKNAIFGANKHEGSFVLGSKIFKCNSQVLMTYSSDLRLLHQAQQCDHRHLLPEVRVHRGHAGRSGYPGQHRGHLRTRQLQILRGVDAWVMGGND